MAHATPLWLDCDTGHDDAFALLLAGRHPGLRLLGVSTLYGNAPLEHTTYNTRAVLRAIGRDGDVAVYAGASEPLCRAATHAADIHGASGLDGTSDSLPTPVVPARTDVTAVEATYRALRAEPAGTAWLVATGALTNAAALFAAHPDLADHLAGVSIMGGAIGGGFSDAPMGVVAGEGERFGNQTPWAEFNIYIDPESASAIFANPVLAAKTTLITLDLTHQFVATKEVQHAMLHGFDAAPGKQTSLAEVSVVRRLFFEILTFFAKTYADVFGLTAGPPTHDPLAVAVILAPDWFDDRGGERYDVTVITSGEHGSSANASNGQSQCGRTVGTLRRHGESGVRIPRSLHVDRIWRMLEECLVRAENRSTDFD